MDMRSRHTMQNLERPSEIELRHMRKEDEADLHRTLQSWVKRVQ